MSNLQFSQKIRVDRKRTIDTPKKIAEKLGIVEGNYLLISVKDDTILLKPVSDAITISLKGDKFAKVTLKELEEESIRAQEEYIEGKKT